MLQEQGKFSYMYVAIFIYCIKFITLRLLIKKCFRSLSICIIKSLKVWKKPKYNSLTHYIYIYIYIYIFNISLYMYIHMLLVKMFHKSFYWIFFSWDLSTILYKSTLVIFSCVYLIVSQWFQISISKWYYFFVLICN